MTARAELIAETIRTWPDRPNLTLAKALYAKYPDLWSSVNAVRSSIRAARGVNGSKNRQVRKDKSLFREGGKAGMPLPQMPVSAAEEWTSVRLNPRQTLILSDIHIPYHDSPAVELAIEWGKKRNPDTILLNGDICDFFAVSRWLRDPRKIRLREEIDATIQFFQFLRSQFPKAHVIWKMGNHEERWEHYLWQKAPELLDVNAFDMASIFQLGAFGIDLVKDQRVIMLGKLPALHGHELPKGLASPVNQARGMFLRGLECMIAGHGHRTSEHAEQTFNGTLITTWSTGCLCNLTPEYARVNKWNSGFAFVTNDRDGAFAVENKRIYRGKVW